jgi:rRNA-processing protein FCF1
MHNVIVDTSRIIERLQANALDDYFGLHLQEKNKLFIDPHVLAELDSDVLFEPEQKITLQKLIQKYSTAGLIIESTHRYRLKRPFKDLYQDLKNSHVGGDRTDRHLIALSIQENATLDTTDGGITRTLNKLKFSNNRWRQFMV